MKKYSSVLIHPDVAGGRCAGEITCTTSEIQFVSEDFQYSIKLNNASIRAGGAGNRFVFLTEKGQDSISIYTSEKSILKDINILSNPHFIQEISSSKKTLNSSMTALYIVLGSLILIIGGLFFFKDKMIEKVAKQVPKEWEKTAGDKLFSTLSLQYHFIKNDSLKKEFLKVADPLFSQIEKEGYAIDLYFVQNPTINAFALPGGKVIIQTGLIQNAKSWEEVMGVLSHELAHVTRRHHIRGIINNIGIYTLLAVVVGDVSAFAGTFAQLGGDLASLANSRDFENEADETGLAYLEKAKMKPEGLISFFETLKKENATALDSAINSKVDLSFLSTHPNTQDRIDNLKEKVKSIKTDDFHTLPTNFNTFKTALLESN